MKAKVLIEMASTDGHEYFSKTTFFHGTDNDAAGKKIVKDGFVKPRRGLTKTNIRKAMEPMAGAVYVTTELETAVIYAIGGVMMGGPFNRTGKSRYGWLFVLDGSKTEEFNVDEDKLGEIAHDILAGRAGTEDAHGATKKLSPATLAGMTNCVRMFLTPLQAERCRRYDDFAHLTIAGKKLADRINGWRPTLLRRIAIETGSNLAMMGKMPVKQAWRIDKRRSPELERDGSNFFVIADRVR